MKNKLFLILGLIIIVGSIFWGIKNSPKNLQVTAPVDGINATTTATTTDTTKGTTVINQSTEKKAWNTFQNYLNFAKNHDLNGVKSLSYKISATCSDSSKTSECNGLMDNVYYFGKAINEKDLTNVWEDSKQVILSSDFKFNREMASSTAYIRSIIVFIKNTDGNLKLLSFNPFDGPSLNNNLGEPDQIEYHLKALVKDSDLDMVPDEVETCTYQNAPKNCTKTNPNKRDSLGDGWWDGVRALLKP